VAIKNGQSRDTGNIGCTRHRTKTSKTKNTTQKTKKMSNTDAHKMPRVNTGGRDIYSNTSLSSVNLNLTTVTRWVPLVIQELYILPEHIASCYWILVFCVVFCKSLFVCCSLSFGYCINIVCLSMYGFWLSLWYLQTLILLVSLYFSHNLWRQEIMDSTILFFSIKFYLKMTNLNYSIINK